jgi:hypothetical protein
MKRFLVFCLLCVSVCAGNAQPRFGTMPQGAAPVPAPRPAFATPPVPAPSFGSGGWNSPPQVAAPVQNWVAPPQSVPPQISTPVFGGQPQWNAPVATPQPFGQAQQVNQPPAIAAPVITAPTAQAPTQRPTLQSPTAQGVHPPAVAPSLALPTPGNDTTVPRVEAPVQVQGAAPILSGPAVPRAPPQNAGTGVTTKNSSALVTAVPQEALVGRTPASSRFIAPPTVSNADPQSTAALAQGFLKEIPSQTKNALVGTTEGIYEGLTNTAKAVQKLPGQFVYLQVAGYSPSTYQKAAAEVKAFSTDPSVRQYYANAATTAAQNLVSGTTAAAQRWFQSTDAREPSKAIASATTQAVIGEVAAVKAAKYLNPSTPENVALSAGKIAKTEQAVTPSSGLPNAVSSTKSVIEVPAGSTGNWDRRINPGTTGTLSPNTIYKLDNGHKYLTDTEGRVIEVTANLSPKKMDRNNYQQLCAGASGCAGDEGGHLIAISLGGAGDGINIVPMSETLNRSAWKAMERELATNIQEGKMVNLKINVEYSNSNATRPSQFQITITTDGEGVFREFKQ